MKDSELLQLYGLGLLTGSQFIVLHSLVVKEARDNRQNFKIQKWTLDDCAIIETDYRFTSKKDIRRVFLALDIPNELGFEGFCLLIRRLVYPCRLTDLAKEFYRDPSTLSSMILIMTNWIYANHSYLLKTLKQPWLTHEQLKEFGRVIWSKGAPVKNIWGFIDGTARPICRPKYRQKLYYSGHKRFHCFKYQSIVCPNGLIARLDGPYQGARHDMFMLKHSQLIAKISQITTYTNTKHFILYGDPGYVNSKYIMSPFRDARNTRERTFNATMSSKRISVEWGFGAIIKKFAYADFKKNQQMFLHSLVKQYIVAALLTNCLTCLYGNETSEYFGGLTPPSLETYLQV